MYHIRKIIDTFGKNKCLDENMINPVIPVIT